jgi:hypothetical protein
MDLGDIGKNFSKSSPFNGLFMTIIKTPLLAETGGKKLYILICKKIQLSITFHSFLSFSFQLQKLKAARKNN